MLGVSEYWERKGDGGGGKFGGWEIGGFSICFYAGRIFLWRANINVNI